LSDVPFSSGPLVNYQLELASGRMLPDPAQLEAAHALQLLADQLALRRQGVGSLRQRLKRLFGARPPDSVRGLYFWGGVGRGKTCLMDLFYRSLPGVRKSRLHFNRFMQLVHQQLALKQGQKNPLDEVAADFARNVDVLCFDEFYVADIGDAMILAALLKGLFIRDVVLVTTSNVAPDGLYQNGLQRQNFLPAIDLLNRFTRVMNVDGGTDYRLASLDRAAMYHSPESPESEAAMEALFAELTMGQELVRGIKVPVQERPVSVRLLAIGVIWFEFKDLCGSGRGTADYIELARQYHTVFVSGMPALNSARDDEARRFVSMIDEFYDHGVKVVLAAAVDLASLYSGNLLAFAFERTQSRLLEMQTREYLGMAHRPD